MMTESAPVGFVQPATVCLADTSLLTPPLPEPAEASAAPEDKKQVKKRKSWGQELPVPKTNLPPRKRAKTDDEKEQRRIERVLRNRAAAQSSRERKRQEVEKLEGERDLIHQQNHLLRQRLLQVEEEKFKLKQEVMEMRALLGKPVAGELTPAASPSPLLASELFADHPTAIKQELDELPLIPTHPARASFTPESTPSVADFPCGPAASLDLTQHPAAMLCDDDLQCQSSGAARSPAAAPWPARAVARSDPAQALATQLLFRRIHSSVYSTVLSPLCQLLASLKRGSRLRTATITPMLFRLILWLISTPTSPLTARPLATSTTTPPPPPTTRTPSISSPSTTPSSTFRTSLLRRFLACSPALARPLKDATAAALHETARYALRESSDGRGRTEAAEVVGGPPRERDGGPVTGGSSKAEMWRLMTMALVIDQFERERIRREASGPRR